MQTLPYELYTTEQIRQIENIAIEELGIASYELMQRAGHAAFATLIQHWPEAKKICIFCGGGNNGGVLFPGGTLVTGNSDQLGSATGRLGYTWGPALLYAKGGYAWRDGNNLGVSVAGVPAAFTTNGNHKDGYTVGGGLEYMFAPNWSAKAEYQYYNFGNTTLNTGPADVAGRSFRNDEHTVKAGVNYRFGWGGPAASRY